TLGAYITWRMRRIETAIRHFGAGELSVRMPSDSGDAIGRLARAFNQMAERIQLLVGSHQRLCADMAHELRSPMTRLLLALPGVRRGSTESVDRIDMEASRVIDLLDELLEVARAEVDPAALQCEPVDLESLLTEIVDHCSFEAAARRRDIQLALSAPGKLRGDSEMLRRSVENVLRNAVQHAPEGTRIQLSCTGDAATVVIQVRDWGTGVPEPTLPEIFRPFYRVDRPRDHSHRGTGLGLAIAERAIALHQGSIGAENCSPGLRITIRLPR